MKCTRPADDVDTELMKMGCGYFVDKTRLKKSEGEAREREVFNVVRRWSVIRREVVILGCNGR